MKNYISEMPIQKLPLSKKTDEWKENCVDYFIGVSDIETSDNLPDREELQSYYNLYNGVYNEKDLKYVTNPFNQDDGFPAMAQDYNIIKPKIDVLLGEELKRPFNFTVCRTSDIASSEIQDTVKNMLMSFMMANIMAKMNPEEAARFQQALDNGEIQTPEQIHKYATKDYKDIAEITAHTSAKFLYKYLNMPHMFNNTFKDVLCAGSEYIYTGIKNGNPYAERVNTLDFKYADEDVDFVDEATWCVRRSFMSYSEIYDRFYDKLTESQLDKILELANQTTLAGHGKEHFVGDYNHIDLHRYNTLEEYAQNKTTDNILVYHVCWKSFKKIGFVTLLNPETEEIEEFEVDESYKETGNEVNVEWTWILETWEGYRAGDDSDAIYFGIQPLEYQFSNNDTLNSARLPYTGATYCNTNSKSKSLVAIMKPLQYMYIILWYRLELAIARDKGKIPVIDITQIPKSMGIDVEKWMHYMTALGVMFVNPYEEGWQIVGREGGKPSAYNQWVSVDASMANTINTYVNLLSKIEQMVSELSGITPQRQGAISSNELVGNVERSVVQSAHITEVWFWKHNQVKRRVLSMLLNISKYVWKLNDKKYLHYILDDGTRTFLKLDDNFFYEDFDLFVSDSTKDLHIIEQLQSLIQPAMQNGASLLDAAEILTLDNLTMIKNKLEELETKRAQQIQEQQQAQAQNEQQLAQIENEVREKELLLKQSELDLEKYKIDQDNATKITVAQLNTYRYLQDLDQNGNGIPDPIEIGNQEIARQKLLSEINAKQMELDNKNKADENKRKSEENKIKLQKEIEQLRVKLEKEKLDLENKKLNQAMALQKQKDKAAMEREKLKARTVLKNKTNAEAAKSK